MSDDARTDDPGDEERLPWLEAVEEDDDRDGPSVAKLIAAIVIGLAAIGLIVGGLFWLGNRSRGGGDGALIAAPDEPYKIKASDSEGMAVDNRANASAAAADGRERPGVIDDSAVPERPVTPPAPRPAPAPQPAPAPAPPRPAPAPAAAGPTIQLGAFSTQAAATRAWNAMAARFRYLAPLSHSVVPVQSGGRTLYRLRASGPDAAGICRRLQVAGEDCATVD